MAPGKRLIRDFKSSGSSSEVALGGGTYVKKADPGNVLGESQNHESSVIILK